MSNRLTRVLIASKIIFVICSRLGWYFRCRKNSISNQVNSFLSVIIPCVLTAAILYYSVGCGESKNSVTDEYLKQQEAFLTAKNRAEKDLRMYTNLVSIIIHK